MEPIGIGRILAYFITGLMKVITGSKKAINRIFACIHSSLQLHRQPFENTLANGC
jgi:hypothetical protein